MPLYGVPGLFPSCFRSAFQNTCDRNVQGLHQIDTKAVVCHDNGPGRVAFVVFLDPRGETIGKLHMDAVGINCNGAGQRVDAVQVE